MSEFDLIEEILNGCYGLDKLTTKQVNVVHRAVIITNTQLRLNRALLARERSGDAQKRLSLLFYFFSGHTFG